MSGLNIENQTDVRWIGFLGSSGSYLAVYIFLFISTTHHLGKDFISPTESSSGFAAQMTIWHNLLAIWLWRYLISAVEGIAIPGLISVRGWITYHLPSYYLWITALFFSMLLTKKTASSGVSISIDLEDGTLIIRKSIRGMPAGCPARPARALRRAREVSREVERPARLVGQAVQVAAVVHPSRPSRTTNRA